MPLSQPDAEKMRVHLFTAMRNLMEAMEVFILVDKNSVDRDVYRSMSQAERDADAALKQVKNALQKLRQ